MLSILTLEQIEELYCSYVNDFLTLERFAEYWKINEDLASDIIERGRENWKSKLKL